MTDPYSGREQTEAKHFILRRYLQALAFKVLTFKDITYVDGFSGPWETKDEKFSDSSFMIAISVLLDAQKQYQEREGIRRKIRCFFSETNREAFSQLEQAVAPYHWPIVRITQTEPIGKPRGRLPRFPAALSRRQEIQRLVLAKVPTREANRLSHGNKGCTRFAHIFGAIWCSFRFCSCKIELSDFCGKLRLLFYFQGLGWWSRGGSNP